MAAEGTVVFILAGAVAWAMAAFLLLVVRPAPRLNRHLAAIFALEGAAQIGLSTYILGLERVPGLSEALAAVAISMAALYLLFLAVLETPLVRPLRARRVRVLIKGGLVGAAGTLLVFGVAAALGLRSSTGGVPDALGIGVLGFLGAAYVLGLAAAVSAYRRTKAGSTARRRARAFALGFGSRDASFVALVLVGYLAILLLGLSGSEASFFLALTLAWPVGLMLSVAFLTYGILREQLFDIDVKVKVAVRKSTVVGLFAGGFFVASEALEAVLPVDDALLGVLAAGLIALGLRPIQRAAQGLAERLMPGVDATVEHLASRKVEVYRAAVEGALADGALSSRERAILAGLADELGLSPEDVQTVEDEVIRAHGAQAEAGPAVSPAG